MSDSTKSSTLAEALPVEIKRVKELIEIYSDPNLKGAGDLAVALMKIDVKKAEDATLLGDTVGMINSYNELRTYEA